VAPRATARHVFVSCGKRLIDLIVDYAFNPMNSASAMIPSLRESVHRESRSNAAAAAAAKTARSPSIDYLRAFVVFLVVAFHSTLAYLPYAPAPAQFVGGLEAWRAFPVMDDQRSPAAGAFLLVNDTFFMALMFFVSGLFVWRSLRGKGSVSFLRDRILRLGIPFLFGVSVILPIAHFTSYLQSSGEPGFGDYWRAWWALSYWPSGPMWFISLLLVFDIAAAGVFACVPDWGERIGALASRIGERPARLFAIVLILSALAYAPLALAYGAGAWTHWGLFQFQTSRPAHYFVYFVVGVAVGVHCLQKGPLSRDGELARQWWLWALAAAVSGALAAGLVIAMLILKESAHRMLVYASLAAFVLSCATLSFACLAIFTRFVHKSNPILDSLAANSYGIYIVHYALVAWLQFALLHASLTAAEKWGVVAVLAYAASWLATAAARQLPAIARIV
jgi:peptidoglycan/LPS O-acetylase OafA/YrhL